METVNKLKEEASELKRKFLENDERVLRAESEADLAEAQAKQAESVSEEYSLFISTSCRDHYWFSADSKMDVLYFM